ncbi:MAG: hypothetical protein ACTSQG_03925 [Promethearchaeota archaeon]
MVLMDIIGMEEGFFYQNVAFIAIYIMLGLYFYFGLKFIKDSRDFDKGSAQRAYFVGLGFFIISVAFGEGIYLSDLVFRLYTGERLFYELAMWQRIVGYELKSFIDRDYYIVAFTFILLSLSFLMKPLEQFMLRREKPIMTYLNRILIPFPIIIRFMEVNIGHWFGNELNVVEGSLPYYIFMGLWILVIGVIALSIILLVGLYLKMGISSPKGSNIRKKSFLIIIGIIFWIVAVFLTATVFREIAAEKWYFVPIIPLLLILSLGCMMSGFKREF